ncbi:MAG: methylmalonyl-CoA mutase family protein [Actinomycetia bacterium]|nr:methylmalonyl-CoA mutase family protein [Actinomycetes bacterium]
MTEAPLQLAGGFPISTAEDWETEVLKGLNRRRPAGKELTIEQAMVRLRTVTADQLTIEPLYTDHPGPLGYPGVAPFTRGATVRSGAMDAWDVRALHEDPDVAFTNAQIRADLDRGAASLWLRLGEGAIPTAALADILAGVGADTPICVSGPDRRAAAAALAAHWAGAGAGAGNLGIDPLGEAAVTGAAADLSDLARWVAEAERWPGARALVVDTLVYDDAGAGDVEQLAYAAATGVAYLRALEEQGVAPERAVRQFLFRVSANADEFATIARLRALRRIWARVAQVCGAPAASAGAAQHAVTSWRMVTRDDPWVNLLRGTIATFSAAVGGAEAITVLPFDAARGLPTDFSRRLARNTQLIAAQEANIGRVNDPAGGAWTFERLTDQLAEKAWALFQRLEAGGGMAAALASGQVAEQIAAVNAERAKRLATRRQPITGVSMFPKDGAESVETRPRPATAPTGGLAPIRDSAVFEALRDRAAAATPHPAVFLARLGEQRDFGARETFTAAMLAVAGFDRPSCAGGSPDEVAAQAAASGARLVIMCSSAKVYAEQGCAVATALKAAGVGQVWIAGRRAETGCEHAAEVIDGEVFDGMDVVEFLDRAMDLMGVAK